MATQIILAGKESEALQKDSVWLVTEIYTETDVKSPNYGKKVHKLVKNEDKKESKADDKKK